MRLDFNCEYSGSFPDAIKFKKKVNIWPLQVSTRLTWALESGNLQPRVSVKVGRCCRGGRSREHRGGCHADEAGALAPSLSVPLSLCSYAYETRQRGGGGIGPPHIRSSVRTAIHCAAVTQNPPSARDDSSLSRGGLSLYIYGCVHMPSRCFTCLSACLPVCQM